MQNIKNSLFLSCLKATGFIEKKQAIGLTFKEEIQLKIHLSMCKACSSYEHQSRAIEDGIVKNYKKKNKLENDENLDQFEKEIIEKIKNL
jgi:hypothetical protein